MATAVKSPPEAAAPEPQSHLLRASLVGALYVALCLALVIFGLPYLWKQTVAGWIAAHLGGFFDPTGMALIVLGGAIGLLYLGMVLADRTGSPSGLRAGVFTFVVGGLLLFLVTVWFGRFLQSDVIKDPTSKAGLALTIGFAVLLIVLAVQYLVRGGKLERFLVAFESQGWFRARSYKPTQGQRVRRLTMLGILLLVGSGVWTMIEHKSLSGNWTIRLPFTLNLLQPDNWLVATLLPDIRYTVPLLLIALGLWGSWRAVNYPVFADFLIATEAELNKVSWTNRKRLAQDTIVVLVTLVLFTVFLLAVDQLWGWLLTRETLGGIVPKAPVKAPKDAKDTVW